MGCGLDVVDGYEFDVIINGTSAGLTGNIPPLPYSFLSGAGASACCHDLMYVAEPTPFIEWAQRGGAQASDGLGMLVEQAAESFHLWRGVRPQTKAVIQSLRSLL